MDSAEYRLWMRERFPFLNQGLDEELSERSIMEFVEEIQPVTEAIASDRTIDSREQFTYISMIHSAMYHHRMRAFGAGLSLHGGFEQTLIGIENTMIELAEAIGVEHRFLSVFYLFYNPEIPDLQGKFVQFRPSEYETAFLRINKEGTLQYKLAARSLSKVYTALSTASISVAAMASALETTASSFRKISHGNSMLLKTPGGEEFKYLTQYFGEVKVAGKTMRGVNAGDQPWSYIIDLLLGVDLKRVFERAFEGTPSERHYPSRVKTSAEVVAVEFQLGAYLHPNYMLPEDYKELEDIVERANGKETLPILIAKKFSSAEQSLLAGILHLVIKQYLAASNVHYQLARRHVPKDLHGEQIGSAGTNIVSFLKEGLNAEREKVKHEIEQQYPELLKKGTESSIA